MQTDFLGMHLRWVTLVALAQCHRPLATLRLVLKQGDRTRGAKASSTPPGPGLASRDQGPLSRPCDTEVPPGKRLQPEILWCHNPPPPYFFHHIL